MRSSLPSSTLQAKKTTTNYHASIPRRPDDAVQKNTICTADEPARQRDGDITTLP